MLSPQKLLDLGQKMPHFYLQQQILNKRLVVGDDFWAGLRVKMFFDILDNLLTISPLYWSSVA